MGFERGKDKGDGIVEPFLRRQDVAATTKMKALVALKRGEYSMGGCCGGIGTMLMKWDLHFSALRWIL
jgi:hypothetical protein